MQNKGAYLKITNGLKTSVKSLAELLVAKKISSLCEHPDRNNVYVPLAKNYLLLEKTITQPIPY